LKLMQIILKHRKQGGKILQHKRYLDGISITHNVEALAKWGHFSTTAKLKNKC